MKRFRILGIQMVLALIVGLQASALLAEGGTPCASYGGCPATCDQGPETNRFECCDSPGGTTSGQCCSYTCENHTCYASFPGSSCPGGTGTYRSSNGGVVNGTCTSYGKCLLTD